MGEHSQIGLLALELCGSIQSMTPAGFD
jgi:hypothetical protein